MLRAELLFQGRVQAQVRDARVLAHVHPICDAVHRVRAVGEALPSRALERVVARTRWDADQVVGVVVIHEVIGARRRALAVEYIRLIAPAGLRFRQATLSILELCARDLAALSEKLVILVIGDAGLAHRMAVDALILAYHSGRVVVLVFVALLNAQQLAVALPLQEVGAPARTAE